MSFNYTNIKVPTNTNDAAKSLTQDDQKLVADFSSKQSQETLDQHIAQAAADFSVMDPKGTMGDFRNVVTKNLGITAANNEVSFLEGAAGMSDNSMLSQFTSAYQAKAGTGTDAISQLLTGDAAHDNAVHQGAALANQNPPKADGSLPPQVKAALTGNTQTDLALLQGYYTELSEQGAAPTGLKSILTGHTSTDAATITGYALGQIAPPTDGQPSRTFNGALTGNTTHDQALRAGYQAAT